MGKKWLIIGAVVVVAGIAGIIGYQRLRGGNGEADETQETALVERGTLEATIGGTGSLVPRAEVSVAFASGGQVAEVLVAEGDTVERDQPLAVLDTRDLNLSFVSSEANLSSAESGLSSAQTSLNDLLAGADERELALAKISVDQAKDKLWGSQAQRDGVCGRVENGRGEDYECDSAEASVLQAQDAVRIAEIQYEDLLDGASEVEVAGARDKVTQAQAQVATAQSQVDQALLRLEQATLSAPISGTVTAVNVTAGETAGASQAAVVLGDLSALEVVISLDETDVADVATGQEALVLLDAFPEDELTGTVTAIAPVAQVQSGVVLFPVTVTLDGTDLPARPGMTAEVEIVMMSVADALIIPLRAVISGPRGDMVMRVTIDGATGSKAGDRAGSARQGGGDFGDGPPPGMAMGDGRFAAASEGGTMRQAMESAGAEPVPVTLGATTETHVEVLSGLSEGDVVIVPDTSATMSDGRPGGVHMPMGGMFRGRP